MTAETTPAPGGVAPSGAVPPVELRGVSKWYGNVVACSEITCRIGPGVTALLGPNGAGKSTAMRLICGLARPSQGQVALYGRDPRLDVDVLRHIGIVPQQERVFPGMDARTFVRLAAELNCVDDPDAATDDALAVVELDPSDRRPVETFSKGMRQRVKVAQALVTGPSIVVADEPLSGLDPRQRARLVGVLRDLGEEGRCVLVSSHVLDEVERFGSQVLVIARGRLVAEGDFRKIRELMDERPHLVRVRTDRPHALGSWLLAAGVVTGVEVTGVDSLRLETRDILGLADRLAPTAQQVEATLSEVEPLDDDLESVFRYLVDDAPRRLS